MANTAAVTFTYSPAASSPFLIKKAHIQIALFIILGLAVVFSLYYKPLIFGVLLPITFCWAKYGGTIAQAIANKIYALRFPKSAITEADLKDPFVQESTLLKQAKPFCLQVSNIKEVCDIWNFDSLPVVYCSKDMDGRLFFVILTSFTFKGPATGSSGFSPMILYKEHEQWYRSLPSPNLPGMFTCKSEISPGVFASEAETNENLRTYLATQPIQTSPFKDGKEISQVDLGNGETLTIMVHKS